MQIHFPNTNAGQGNYLMNSLITCKANIVCVSIHVSHLCLLIHVDCGAPKLLYADVLLSLMDYSVPLNMGQFCIILWDGWQSYRLRMGARRVDREADR